MPSRTETDPWTRVAMALESIAASLATLAAEPYRPTKQDVVAVRDAAGSSLYRAQDALVRYRGDVAAAIEFLAPQTK